MTSNNASKVQNLIEFYGLLIGCNQASKGITANQSQSIDSATTHCKVYVQSDATTPAWGTRLTCATKTAAGHIRTKGHPEAELAPPAIMHEAMRNPAMTHDTCGEHSIIAACCQQLKVSVAISMQSHISGSALPHITCAEQLAQCCYQIW